MTKPDVDFGDVLNRIESEPGVTGIIVMGSDGGTSKPETIIHSVVHNTETMIKHANMTNKTLDYARSVVKNFDPTNDLLVLRMGTKHHEIIVAREHEFTITVLQVVPNQTTADS